MPFLLSLTFPLVLLGFVLLMEWFEHRVTRVPTAPAARAPEAAAGRRPRQLPATGHAGGNSLAGLREWVEGQER